jgi:hypothetical protein
MRCNLSKPVWTALIGAISLGSSVTPAGAQSSPNFQPGAASYPQTAGMEAAAPSYAPPAGFQQGQTSAPYYPPYYPSYPTIQSPVAGYLDGTANMMAAQGQWMKDLHTAGIIKEQNKQAMTDTRRKNYDEWLYERENTPTPEDDRQRQQMEMLRRSLNNPPASEIFSGQALNTIMAVLQTPVQMGAGPNIPLDPQILRRVNVSGGTSTGNIGVLKGGGNLRWPTALRDSAFASERQDLDRLARQASKEAATGNVDFGTIQQMQDAVNKINNTIRSSIDTISMNDYTAAKQYVRQLESAIKALGDAEVANYATGKWSATGNSVSELVMNMTRQGLRFAPATQGDEPAYMAIHGAFVAFDEALPEPIRMAPTAKQLRTQGPR